MLNMSDNLIKWVKKELEIKDISHRQLAKATGLSNTFVSAVLSGKREVSMRFCKAVSKGLDEPIWNVLMMAGEIEDVPESVAKSEDIRVLLTKYGKLSSEGKDDLLKYLDWILKKENAM